MSHVTLIVRNVHVSDLIKDETLKIHKDSSHPLKYSLYLPRRILGKYYLTSEPFSSIDPSGSYSLYVHLVPEEKVFKVWDELIERFGFYAQFLEMNR